MFEIKAKSRFLDLSKSFKSFYALGIGVFLSVLTYLIYQNLVVTITLGVCTIATYIILSQPPKDILIRISEEGLLIDEELLGFEVTVGWAMVDLGDVLEFVVQTPNFVKDFYYFYIDENDSKVKQFIPILSQYLPYDEEIAGKNQVHNFLRNVGMK